MYTRLLSADVRCVIVTLGELDMAAIAERSTMAKKQGRPKKPSGEGMQVRIDAQIGRRAKVVASESGVSLADYLSGILRDRVEKDYRKVVKDLSEGDAEK
jgi:hypothetical protein